MGAKAAATFALGGGVIVVLKAAHVATTGAFGIPSAFAVTKPAVGMAGLPAGVSSRSFPAPATSGGRPGIAVFRETEFAAPAPATAEPPLL